MTPQLALSVLIVVGATVVSILGQPAIVVIIACACAVLLAAHHGRRRGHRERRQITTVRTR